MKVVCIYHGNCADGFTSAWAFRAFAISHRFIGAVTFHAGVYQDPPPDVTGSLVVMLDFSYKRPVLEKLAEQSEGILVLDHHKTTAEDLKAGGIITDLNAYTGVMDWARFLANCAQDRMEGCRGRVYALLDMERSGAGITWDFFLGAPRHPLVNHVEDRDLWRFALPGTREIQAAVFSYPYEFEAWDKIADSFDQFGHTALVTEGAAIERKHHKDIAELTKVVTRPMKFRYPPNDGPAPADLGFIAVPMANLPYTLTSDAGHLLCGDDYPFAGCYWDTPTGRVFSLRSRDNGADVGEIAKQYGGGGHAHASGFRVGYDQLAQFEP